MCVRRWPPKVCSRWRLRDRHADGGVKHWRLGLPANHSITGDLTGGLWIFRTGGYAKLTEDSKDGPIVDRPSNSSQ
jgi:outer membrane scaffolding protein for murein synthesis (MipA/OmpV family)